MLHRDTRLFVIIVEIFFVDHFSPKLLRFRINEVFSYLQSYKKRLFLICIKIFSFKDNFTKLLKNIHL